MVFSDRAFQATPQLQLRPNWEFPLPEVGALFCDRALYQRGRDVVHLALVAALFRRPPLRLVLERDGKKWRELAVKLDDFGMAEFQLPELPEGHYQALWGRLECCFEVVEKISLRLQSWPLDIRRQGDFVDYSLYFEHKGQPLDGEVRFWLADSRGIVPEKDVAYVNQGRLDLRIRIEAGQSYQLLWQPVQEDGWMGRLPLWSYPGKDWILGHFSSFFPTVYAAPNPLNSTEFRGLHLWTPQGRASEQKLELRGSEVRVLKDAQEVFFVSLNLQDGQLQQHRWGPVEAGFQQEVAGSRFNLIFGLHLDAQGSLTPHHALRLENCRFQPSLEISPTGKRVQLRGGPESGQVYLVVKDYRACQHWSSEKLLAEQLQFFIEDLQQKRYEVWFWKTYLGRLIDRVASALEGKARQFWQKLRPPPEPEVDRYSFESIEDVVGQSQCLELALAGDSSGLLFAGLLPIVEGRAELSLEPPPGLYKVEATLLGDGDWGYTESWFANGEPLAAAPAKLDFSLLSYEREAQREADRFEVQLLLEGLLARLDSPSQRLRLSCDLGDVQLHGGGESQAFEGDTVKFLLRSIFSQSELSDHYPNGWASWSYAGRDYLICRLKTRWGYRVSLRRLADAEERVLSDPLPVVEDIRHMYCYTEDRLILEDQMAHFKQVGGVALIQQAAAVQLFGELPQDRVLGVGLECFGMSSIYGAVPVEVLRELEISWIFLRPEPQEMMRSWLAQSEELKLLLVYRDEVEEQALKSMLESLATN